MNTTTFQLLHLPATPLSPAGVGVAASDPNLEASSPARVYRESFLGVAAYLVADGWTITQFDLCDRGRKPLDEVRQAAYSSILVHEAATSVDNALDVLTNEIPNFFITHVRATKITSTRTLECTIAANGDLTTNALEEVLAPLNRYWHWERTQYVPRPQRVRRAY